MTEYKLILRYDEKTGMADTRDVYGNWPEHHKALKEQAEKNMRSSRRSGLTNLVTTITIHGKE